MGWVPGRFHGLPDPTPESFVTDFLVETIVDSKLFIGIEDVAHLLQQGLGWFRPLMPIADTHAGGLEGVAKSIAAHVNH